MNYISPSASLELHEVLTPEPGSTFTQYPFWRPYRLREPFGGLHFFNDNELTTAGTVVSQLPGDYDGFMVGIYVDITTPSKNQAGLIINRPKIYIPGERCEPASFKEVEQADRMVATGMVVAGITKALKIPNGYMPYHPDFVAIVGEPREK